MANWDKLGGSGNVEDRRGMSPLAMGGGGLGLLGVAVYVALNLLGGGTVDLNGVLQQLQVQGSVQQQDTSQFAGQDDYEKFTATVLGSTNVVWQEVFAKNSKQYAEPKLVLFRTATQSACGGATSDVGPHYCPTDETIYIDEIFLMNCSGWAARTPMWRRLM